MRRYCRSTYILREKKIEKKNIFFVLQDQPLGKIQVILLRCSNGIAKLKKRWKSHVYIVTTKYNPLEFLPIWLRRSVFADDTDAW